MVSWEKFRKQKEFSHTKVRLKVVSRQQGAAQHGTTHYQCDCRIVTMI